MGSSATTAFEWLGRASARLGVADPCESLGDALALALPDPLGRAESPPNALLPGVVPFELSFSEAAPGALRLDFEPLGWGRSNEKVREAATAVVRDLVARRWGRAAGDSFAARAAARDAGAGQCRFGAFAGAMFDADGLCEAKVYYPGATAELDGFQGLMTSVGVADGRVVERAYLVCRTQFDLLSLEQLLRELQLGHRAPELIFALARLAGGALSLGPGGVVVGLRRQADGVELKVELPTAGLRGDALGAVGALLAERPATHAAFRRWLAAVSLPVSTMRASVVSARVSADRGVRLSTYVHPVAHETGKGGVAGGTARLARVG